MAAALATNARKMLAYKLVVYHNYYVARVTAVGQVAERVSPRFSAGDFAIPATEARESVSRGVQ